jgi:hypothetical protein
MECVDTEVNLPIMTSFIDGFIVEVRAARIDVTNISICVKVFELDISSL